MEAIKYFFENWQIIYAIGFLTTMIIIGIYGARMTIEERGDTAWGIMFVFALFWPLPLLVTLPSILLFIALPSWINKKIKKLKYKL